MLTLQSVSKQYQGRSGGTVDALQEVDLVVDRGEFVTIDGPSGSGKSTLLFTVGAMLRPTHGDVWMDNQPVYGLSQNERAVLRRKSIGFLFQTFNLIPYLDAVQNVALPAMIAGAPRREAHDRARALIDRVGLGQRQRHRPTELSVGERQRVALCRAVVNEPAWLLADEPTGNLDPPTAREIVGLLGELHDRGLTILLATHDPEVADAGTRRISLSDGCLVADSTRPQSGPC